QRENDPPEPDRVDPVEEAHAEGDPGDRGGCEHGGEAPHLSRQEPRPPIAREDHHLVHDEEGLEVRLDRARAPSLGRRVEDDRRPRRPDRAADHPREHAGAQSPAAALELRGSEAAPLERPGDHQHETDQPVERGRGQARERPHTEGRADDRPDQEVHHGGRGEVLADGDEDREREDGRVERHEHDRLGGRHEVGEKGEGDETAAEAGEPNDRAGSAWIATIDTVPQTRTTSVTARAAAGWPETSKATSTPVPPVHSLANLTGSRSGPTVSRPSAFKISSRWRFTSTTTTRAPRWRLTSAISAPIGPPPKTSTASSRFTAARRTSCVATASGSMSAAWSSPRGSGTLRRRAASTAQYSCMPPGRSTPSTL